MDDDTEIGDEWRRPVKRLFPPDQCVVCWHGPHKDKRCEVVDQFPCEDENYPGSFVDQVCGCGRYTTEEERGKILVKTKDAS